MSRISEYKRFERDVPFTVSDVNKGAAEVFNLHIEAKSISKRLEARERTIAAWTAVQSNHEAYKAGAWIIQDHKLLANANKPKTSVLSKIYNWFLTINF